MCAIERVTSHPKYTLIRISRNVRWDAAFDRALHEGVFHVSGGLDRLLALRLVAFHDRATDVVAFVFRKPADMFREVHDCLLIHDEVIRIREDFLEQRVTPIILLSRFRFQIETVDMRCERAWAIYRRQNCDVIDRRRFSLLKELLRTPRRTLEDATPPAFVVDVPEDFLVIVRVRIRMKVLFIPLPNVLERRLDSLDRRYLRHRPVAALALFSSRSRLQALQAARPQPPPLLSRSPPHTSQTRSHSSAASLTIFPRSFGHHFPSSTYPSEQLR